MKKKKSSIETTWWFYENEKNSTINIIIHVHDYHTINYRVYVISIFKESLQYITSTTFFCIQCNWTFERESTARTCFIRTKFRHSLTQRGHAS